MNFQVHNEPRINGPKMRSRIIDLRVPRFHQGCRAALWRVAWAVALALLVASGGLAAEEMTEAEAIAEIKRLRGSVSPALFTREEHAVMVREGFDFHVDPSERLLDARLAGDQFGDEQLKLLKHIPRIVQVGILNCAVTDAGIKVLKSLPQLRYLTIYGRHTGPKFTDGGVNEIGEIKTLRKLYLHQTLITGKGFASLANLENLHTLMADGPGIGDDAVAHIVQLPRLTDLVLGDTNLTDRGLKSLTDVPKLRHLALTANKVTDGGLDCIRDFPALTSFHIRSDKLTDRALEHLKGADRITSLGIGGEQITDAALDSLPAFSNLWGLDLSNNPRITDAALDRLKPLKGLAALNLLRTSISDRGCRKLSAYESLRDLNLSSTDVSDAGLAALTTLRRLQRLIITGTKVTEAGAEDFFEATGIKIPGI